MKQFPQNTTGYNMGHPWYYLRGGRVPPPKLILADALVHNYRGYMADTIEAVANKQEPQRSEKLRQIKAEVLEELSKDISRYRECARDLRDYRQDCHEKNSEPECGDVHVNMGLKYAHIYNGFGHLAFLDSLLEKQPDLFDF